MLISEKFKFIFLAPPKTGTRSIYKLLSSNKFEGKLVGDHKHIVPKKYEGYFTFIVVRNPYFRMLSLYLSCCVEDGDVKGFHIDMKESGFEVNFNSFLRWILLNRQRFTNLNQSKYLILKSQSAYLINNTVDNLIYYENLDKGFELLPFISSEDKIPFLNKTKVNKDKLSWFDDESISLINDYCSEEFKLLDYHKVSTLNEFLECYT